MTLSLLCDRNFLVLPNGLKHYSSRVLSNVKATIRALNLACTVWHTTIGWHGSKTESR